jgi:hypothetical protein
MKTLNTILYLIVATGTSMLAYPINVANGAWFPRFWCVVDFFFWPFAWIKWLVFQEINMTLIKETFSFFFQ